MARAKTNIVEPVFSFGELFRFTNPYTRQRYWATRLAVLGGNVLLTLVLVILGHINPAWIVLKYAVGLVCFWVAFATTIKRLRDANLSLYWGLLNVVPLLNVITFIVFGCIASSEEKNTKPVKGVIISLVCVFVGMMLLVALAVGAALVYRTQHVPAAEAPAPVVTVPNSVVTPTTL